MYYLWSDRDSLSCKPHPLRRVWLARLYATLVQFSSLVLLLPVGLFLRYKFTRSRVMNAPARYDKVS